MLKTCKVYKLSKTVAKSSDTSSRVKRRSTAPHGFWRWLFAGISPSAWVFYLLQVMLAQAPEGGSVEGQAGGYGAASHGSLPNGVPAAAQTSGLVGQSGHGLENPNVHDPAPTVGDRQVEAAVQPVRAIPPPGRVDPAYEHPDLGANGMNTELAAPRRETRLPQLGTSERMTPGTPTSSMRVQEFYSAESLPQGQQGGVRWFARVSEFLRTTAHRGAEGMDRVLGQLRFPTIPQQQTLQTLQVRTSMTSTPLNVSPPEDFPSGPSLPPPVPMSWSSARPVEPPLFDARQVEQMRQAQRDHPWIYGPAGQQSEPESERSSRLQAEVQRQLEEYTLRYQQQVQTLMREVDQLREERSYWKGRASRGAEGQDQLVPREDLPNLPPGAPLPQGVKVPQGDPLILPQDPTVPQGNPQQSTQEGPLESLQELHLPQGDPLVLPQGPTVPPGNLQQSTREGLCNPREEVGV